MPPIWTRQQASDAAGHSRVDANLGALVDLGETPEGHRRIIAWTGGRAEAPDFHAEVLGTGGADWQIVRPSGSSVAAIRYTLKTDRGALLYVQVRVERHAQTRPDQSPEIRQTRARVRAARCS